MRLILLSCLCALLASGEATTPRDRILAGFAAWSAPGGDGAAACAVWLDGAAPAASSGTQALIGTLDAIPAAERQRPLACSDPQPVTANGIKAVLYFVNLPGAGRSVAGFAFLEDGGKPILAALGTEASKVGVDFSRDKLKFQLVRMIASVAIAKPAKPSLPEDPLGPYAFTVPGDAKAAKLVVWGTPFAAPTEIVLAVRPSTVTLRFQQTGEGNRLQIVVAAIDGAETIRELALGGGLPTVTERSGGMMGAGADAKTGGFADGRAELPAAWLGHIRLSYRDAAGASQSLSITLE